jgi:hypothetical protein
MIQTAQFEWRFPFEFDSRIAAGKLVKKPAIGFKEI